MSASGARQRIGLKPDHGDLLDHAVRLGLISYGVVHLMTAWLAVQLVFGDHSEKASNTGALHQLAQSGLGRTSLYVVAAGFGALVVWQAAEAIAGHHDEEGAKRLGKRLVSAGKAVVYGALGVSALKVAMGSSSGGGGTDTWTARLMSAPAGPWLVALVGAVVLVIAGALAYRGWAEQFRDKLDVRGRTGKDGRAYIWFGKIGYVAKGVALGIIGALFVYAAWTHDPQKSGGLDQALSKLLQQPFGPVLLAATAAGIACYGLFCFAWARHLDR